MFLLSYSRLSDRQCLITFAQNHADACALQWSEVGGRLTNQHRHALAAWAMIAMYELVRQDNAHSFLRTLDSWSDNGTPAKRLTTRHNQQSYPEAAQALPSLFDAASAMLKGCTIAPIMGEPFDGQKLTVRVRHEEILDAFGEPTPTQTMLNGDLFDHLPTSFLPHKAPYRPEELHQLPDLQRVYKHIHPFSGPMESGTPDNNIIFTADGALMIAMNQEGLFVAYDTTTFSEQWRADTSIIFPNAHISPVDGQLHVGQASNDLVIIDLANGEMVHQTDQIDFNWAHVSRRYRWSAHVDINADTVIHVGSVFNRLIRREAPSVYFRSCIHVGHHLALIGDRGQTYIWDSNAMALIWHKTIEDGDQIMISPNQKWVVISTSTQVLVMPTHCPDERKAFPIHDSSLVAWTDDGVHIAVATINKEGHTALTFYDCDDRQYPKFDNEPIQHINVEREVSHLCGQGDIVIINTWEQDIYGYSISTGHQHWSQILSFDASRVISTSAAAIACTVGHTAVFDLFTGTPIDAPNINIHPLKRYKWSDFDMPEFITLTIEQENTIEHVAFSEDETQLFFGGMYSTVEQWDLEQGVKLNTHILDGDRLYDLSVSPDGQHIAVASFSYNHSLNTVSIRRTTCGTIVGQMTSHNYINAPRWSPNGKWAAMTQVTGSNGFGGSLCVFKLFHR